MPGGGLGFLNKKYWHPARPQNLEIKWKKEQEAAAEKKRLEELRKQIEEERQREELHSVAERAGIKKREERLDWMYQGGVAARQDADKRAEDALLTGKIPDAPVEQPQSRVGEDTPASANETWARLHNDPLFAIKQQEVAQRKQVLSNPMTMLQLKKQVTADKGDKKHKKKEKKEKKEKKDKKEKHGGDKRRGTSPTDRHRNGGTGGGYRDDRNGHGDDGHGKRRHRDASPDERNGSSKRHRATNGHDHHHHRTDDRRGASDHHHHHHDGRHDGAAHDNSNGHHDGMHNGGRGHGAQAGAQERKYGLDYGAHNPDKAVGYDTSALAAATRQRLEEAAKRKAREEREAAEARSHRHQHTTGRLTAEEKAARLAEMMRNAEEHEAHRTTRVVDATAAEEAEVAKDASRDASKFLRDAAGALGAGTSAAEQIARRKHYSSKDGGRF